MSRILFGPEQSDAIRYLLQSLFVTELLSPSKKLWLVFGWISDVEIIDNRTREFNSLEPDWGNTMIRLSKILKALLTRGSEINLIIRDVPHNTQRDFFRKIMEYKQEFPTLIKYHLDQTIHNKGIVGDDFIFTGSMNLTHYGITVNDESLSFATDTEQVEEWKISLEDTWNEKLK